MQTRKIFLLFFLLPLFSLGQSIDTTKVGVGADTSGGKFNQTLQAFTLTGAKPFIQHRSGKIILNVAESPVAAGGNASDLIKHIPGMQDGSLQYHGRTVSVLIDGRATGLSGENLRTVLDGMPSGTIERVELIESPSARYDAKGGAVINIITVKMKKAGSNGTVTAGLGWGRYARYNTGLALNYQQGKMNLYGGYDYQHSKSYTERSADRRIDTVGQLTEGTNSTRQADNHSFRLGMDYTIDPKSSFGIQAKGMVNYRRSDAFNSSLLSGSASGTSGSAGGAGGVGGGRGSVGSGMDSLSTVTTAGNARFVIPSVNAWFKKVLDSTGREFNLGVDYFRYDKTWSENFVTRYYDQKGMEYGTPVLLRDHSPAKNEIVSLSADYVYPSKLGRWEAGVKTSFTTTDNDILWEQQEGSGWVTDKGITNHFIYRENINAGYVNYGKTLKQFTVELGLRAEQTNTEGRSVTLNQTNRNSYLSLFPNVAVQFARSENEQYGFSYRRSIERYDFDDVNPFIRYISQYSYYQGNPSLRPSTSDNLALSYSWKDEIMVGLSYGRFKDVLAPVVTKIDSSNAVVSSNVNLGSATQMGVDLTYMKGFFNGKLTTATTLSGLYAKYNVAMSTGQSAAKGAVYANTDLLYSFAGGWKAELSAMYFSPLVLGVYTYRSRFSADLGISRSCLGNKGKVALNISDIFNSLVNRYEIASFGVNSVNRQKTESRVIKLVFTYKFGGKGLKNAAGRKTGIDDLRQRMSGN